MADPPVQERGERVAERGVVRVEMVGELDEKPVAEHRREPRQRLPRAVEIAGANRFRHRAVRAAGERVEAGGVLGDEVKGGLRLGLLAGELGRRDRPAERRPALPVPGDENEMTQTEEVELGAEDRTDAALLGRVGEPYSPVEAVRVGERERVHSLLGGGVGEVEDV